MPEDLETPRRKALREPLFMVKNACGETMAGPFDGAMIEALLQAGILTRDTLISVESGVFHPLGNFVRPRAAVAPMETPRVIRQAGDPDADSRTVRTDTPFTGGYETTDVLKYNDALNRKEIDLPPIWKDPRFQDKIRFAVLALPVLMGAVLLVNDLRASGSGDLTGLAGVGAAVLIALQAGYVFFINPTRAGM